MKHCTLFTVVAILANCFTACSQGYKHTFSSGLFSETVEASNNYVTKEIPVKEFEKLSVAGSLDVEYTQQAGAPRVEIHTSDNIIDLLEVRVKGGTLSIQFKKNYKVRYNKLQIRVFSQTLNALSLAGSGDVLLTNGLETDQFSLSVAGSGDIKGDDVRCRKLAVSIAGSGDVRLEDAAAEEVSASIAGSGTLVLSGNAESAEYEISGSGDVRAVNLAANRVSASIAGSGDIRCHAIDFLKARVAGSGDISYKGNPEVDAPRKGLHRIE